MTREIIKTEFLIKGDFTHKEKKGKILYILPKEEKELKELFEKGEKVFAVLSYKGEYTETFHRKRLTSLEEIHDSCSSGLVCGIEMPKNKLLDAEYNVLQLLGTRSHMDSWFWLVEKDGKDIVRDLEANGYKLMALRNALPIFVDGLLDLDHYRLTEEEKEVAYRLFDRFGIEFNPA